MKKNSLFLSQFLILNLAFGLSGGSGAFAQIKDIKGTGVTEVPGTGGTVVPGGVTTHTVAERPTPVPRTHEYPAIPPIVPHGTGVSVSVPVTGVSGSVTGGTVPEEPGKTGVEGKTDGPVTGTGGGTPDSPTKGEVRKSRRRRDKGKPGSTGGNSGAGSPGYIPSGATTATTGSASAAGVGQTSGVAVQAVANGNQTSQVDGVSNTRTVDTSTVSRERASTAMSTGEASVTNPLSNHQLNTGTSAATTGTSTGATDTSVVSPTTASSAMTTGEVSVPDHFASHALTTDAVTGKKKCEDAVPTNIFDIMSRDQGNTLGIMFELTAMRLAKRALQQTKKATTFEEMTSAKIEKLKADLAKIKSSEKIKNDILNSYEIYGKAKDLKTLNEQFDEIKLQARVDQNMDHMFKRNQNGCYFAKNRRMRNDDASAYILAVAKGEEDSGLSELDAATVWVVETARKEAAKPGNLHYKDFEVGGWEGNLLNISSRVTRYLGRITDQKNVVDADAMDNLIGAQEKALLAAFSGVYSTVKASLRACILAETNNCVKCADDRIATFEKENLTLAQLPDLQKGLLKAVVTANNLKVEKELKAKMGDVAFDFSNFSPHEDSDIIPPAPPRGKEGVCSRRASPAPASVTPKRTSGTDQQAQ